MIAIDILTKTPLVPTAAEMTYIIILCNYIPYIIILLCFISLKFGKDYQVLLPREKPQPSSAQHHASSIHSQTAQTVTEGQDLGHMLQSLLRGHLHRTRNHGGTLKEKQAATQSSRKVVFRPRQSANNRFKSYHGLQLSESFQILPLNIETFFLPL